jgi:hypothetical protein
MTDDDQLDRQSFVAQTPIRFAKNVEIFLLRNPADIKQAHVTVFVRAVFCPKFRIALRRVEELMIETSREDF